MWIVLLCDRAGQLTYHERGSVLQWDGEDARRIIKAGQAREATKPEIEAAKRLVAV